MRNRSCRRTAPLTCLAIALLTPLSTRLAAGQPFAHEKLVQPVYAGSAAAMGDVAIDGDVLALGIRQEDVPGQSDAGAVFLYGRDVGGAGNWGLIKKLASPSPAFGEGFGATISLQGDELYVASPNFSSVAGGLFRVFGRNQGGADNWGLIREVPESGTAFCEFGTSMDVEGDFVVIGSKCGDTSYEGRAYVYERNLGGANMWGRRQVLKASDAETNDRFGNAVAISGSLLAVGAPDREPGPWTGGGDNGAVYLFRRDPVSGLWVEWRILTDDAGTGSHLGYDLAIDRSTLLASRYGDLETSVYRCWQGGPGNWGYEGYISAVNAGPWGETMAVDGPLAVIGGSTIKLYDTYDWSFIGQVQQTVSPSADNFLQRVALSGDRLAGGGQTTDPNYWEMDVFVAPTADLAVSADDGQAIAAPSSTLSYDVVVSNNGATTVTGAQLAVELSDTSLDLASVTWTCTESGGADPDTSCPASSGTWGDLDENWVPVGIAPGDTVTLTLSAPVLASPSPPVECRARIRAPSSQAVDPDGSNNLSVDHDFPGISLVFADGFESGDLRVWWGQTGCP